MSRLIDADALTERLNEYANDDWNVSLGGVFTDAVDTCLDFVENAPTIEAVPVVHGEWIFKNDGAYRQRRAYCSVCGKRSGIGGIESNQRKPFCPNCGADMRKGGAE